MNSQQIAPGILYFPRFVLEPGRVFADVMTQVRFTQRSRAMWGRVVATPRMEAWHGSTPYRFGGSELPATELPPILQTLAIECELAVAELSERPRFDTCLVNLYRDGRDSVAWHADDEPEMNDPVIASISLGAPREFMFRRRADKLPRIDVDASLVKVTLEHGSLLVMLRGVQTEWEHCLPKRPACLEPRINLTFRDCSAKART